MLVRSDGTGRSRRRRVGEGVWGGNSADGRTCKMSFDSIALEEAANYKGIYFRFKKSEQNGLRGFQGRLLKRKKPR